MLTPRRTSPITAQPTTVLAPSLARYPHDCIVPDLLFYYTPSLTVLSSVGGLIYQQYISIPRSLRNLSIIFYIFSYLHIVPITPAVAQRRTHRHIRRHRHTYIKRRLHLHHLPVRIRQIVALRLIRQPHHQKLTVTVRILPVLAVSQNTFQSPKPSNRTCVPESLLIERLQLITLAHRCAPHSVPQLPP